MKKKALFIVNTPFQCLCMLEAIHYYSIIDYDVLFKMDGIEKNNTMVEGILNANHIPFIAIRFTHAYELYKHILKRKKRYDILFNGDYYGGGLTAYYYSLIYAKPKATIIYFDDGLQTLHVFAKPPRQRLRNRTEKLMALQFEPLRVLKRIGKPHYFTIFDVESRNFIVERNELKGLRSKLVEKPSEGLFIIGTNVAAFKDKNDYIPLLDTLIQDLRNRYPEDIIWYCPHRRNLEDKELTDFLLNHHLKMYDTKVSVEFDFIEEGVSPKYVAGFGSTALYTLKLLFPKATVENIKIIRDESKKIITEAKEYQYHQIKVETIDYYSK